jgi:hypothetical protein
VIPELPEINSGFAICYPKFPNKIWVLDISDSSSDFGLRFFCPAPSDGGMVGGRDGNRAEELGVGLLGAVGWQSS